ncbi:MAG: T9SS type A sorting domain-containing protein [Bacteroidia bacterium]
MPKNALIIILFLLSFLSAKAQYLGGKGDGYAMGETKNVVLGELDISTSGITAILYPNPVAASGTITIKINSFWSGYKYVTIYNMHGLQVYKTQILPDRELNINLQANYITRGVYIVRFSRTGGKSIHARLVVI